MQDDKNENGADPWAGNDNIIHLSQRKKINLPAARVPFLNIPLATKILLCLFVGLHILAYELPKILNFLPDTLWWVYNFGFIPTRFLDMQIFNWLAPFTPFTYAFLHGGWMHLGVNCLMLLAFGAGFEKNFSPKLMLFIFFTSSVFAAFLHFIFDMNGTTPMIGASGGISGLFGAVLVMLKMQGRLNAQNKLLPIIAVWVGVTVLFGFIGGFDGALIAWVAHLGGFAAGLFLMFIFARRQKLL